MVRNIQPDPYRDLGPDDWWYPDTLPSDAELGPGEPLLTAEQLARFRNDGFLVVTSLWPEALIDQAVPEAKDLHPPDELAQRGMTDADARGFSEMPWTERGDDAADAALNHMTIPPRALAAVAQLIETDPMQLRLSQSFVKAIFGHQYDRPGDPSHETISGDQEIHVDYGNNTLLVPPWTTRPEAVACLCYYSDVDESGGATHFARALPGELTTYEPCEFNPPSFVAARTNGSAADTGPRSPGNTERLYRTEKPVFYRPGTCILYLLNAWHRGTPAAAGKVRHTHHHVWRTRDAEWVNWQSLAPRMAGMPVRYLENLTVEQRTVLGFAAPGNTYWTEETVDAVGQRYPGMDMSPYRAAMKEVG